ncbi:hypothetical protein NM688_g7307 [Phlebia brevispora]|uniref:Uncharacterized protein n=1 Tax=Phlebia brevispora TaxID=194682 RepID=A0ACC1S6U0_9APHY|nr:hypothetical protein NM688_g7307 [Phlebia brevispora]
MLAARIIDAGRRNPIKHLAIVIVSFWVAFADIKSAPSTVQFHHLYTAMRSAVLLTIVVATLAAATNPIIARQSSVTLPFAKVVNVTGTPNILKIDQARIKALKQGTYPAPKNATQGAPPISIPATNQGIIYSASVGVGSPATYYDLIVDTGSSNTWAGANPDKPYVVTSSSVDTGLGIIIAYGSGWVIGEEYNDTVTIGPLVIHNQGTGAEELSGGFSGPGEDGILGLGPVDLTSGTITGVASDQVPTVVDNAYAQGLIPARSIAISFEPTNTTPIANGEVSFGSVDPTRYISEITYTPVTSTSPASRYWGIDETISYNGQIILSTTAGIVDSGTTLLYLASDAYSRYQNATGATLDETTGWLTVTEEQYNNLADLVFTIGGTQFSLTPNAQIWPRALNTAVGLDANQIYLVAQDVGSPTGSGLDFVDGQVFLERFYSVFDTANTRVGFADTYSSAKVEASPERAQPTVLSSTNSMLNLAEGRALCFMLVLADLAGAQNAGTSRWGQAVALVEDTLFIHGGHTDPYNSYSYTSAPVNNDLFSLSLSSAFSLSSPPWSNISGCSGCSAAQGPTVAWHTLTPFNTSSLLLFGGDAGPNSPPPVPDNPDSAVLLSNVSSSTPVWTSEAQSWANEPIRRIYHTASSAGGKVYMVGGQKDDGSGIAFSDHYVFDPAIPSFSSLPSANAPPDITGHQAIVTSDGRLLVFGGYSPSQKTLIPFTTGWSLDTTQASLSWTSVSISSSTVPSSRRGFAATLVDGGKVVIHGGADADMQTTYDDGWVLDTSQSPMSWSSVSVLAQLGPRRDHSAVGLGSLVLFGFGEEVCLPL